jgi:hypothetical protein
MSFYKYFLVICLTCSITISLLFYIEFKDLNRHQLVVSENAQVPSTGLELYLHSVHSAQA